MPLHRGGVGDAGRRGELYIHPTAAAMFPQDDESLLSCLEFAAADGKNSVFSCD